jgi:hypothetical protein
MKIFLSAVSSQFKDCREKLRSDLSAVGAEVVVQEDFQQHGGSLLEKLEQYIAGCDRLIALVGDAYGDEPDESARPPVQPVGSLLRSRLQPRNSSSATPSTKEKKQPGCRAISPARCVAAARTGSRSTLSTDCAPWSSAMASVSTTIIRSCVMRHALQFAATRTSSCRSPATATM